MEGPSPNGDRDWTEWLDGRPRRLKRGVDYTGDPKPVIKRARETAAELGKLAVMSRDSQGRYEYLWVQFVDGEVKRGETCPVCGGTELQKAQKHFLRCARCGSTLKAADGWEVAAGEFAPTPSPFSAAILDGLELVDGGPRAEDFAEIFSARLLSTDGQEIEAPLISEEFVVFFSFRSLRPVDVALPRIRLSAEGAPPMIRLQPSYPLELTGEEIVDAQVAIPGSLLMPMTYSVEIVLLLVPDRALPGHYLKLVWSQALTVRVRKAGPTDITDGDLGTPFSWDIDVGVPDHAV